MVSLCVFPSLEAKEITKKDTTLFPEIVITAFRYPENIYEIPLSVSVINSYQLQDNIGMGFDKTLNSVPGVLSLSRSGTPDTKITIRGFGARGAGDRSNSGTSRGVKFILDGIPETEPDGRTSFDNIDMVFVQNIEVLRSNASSLYGNAAGGVVSLNTFPEHSDDFLKIDALAGSYGLQKYAISAFNKSSNGGILGNASYTKFDGYRANSSAEKFLGNFIFKGKISEKTDFKTLLTGGYNQYYIPGPLSLADYNNSPENANANYLKQQEGRKNYTLRLGGILNHYFNDNNSISAMFYANPKYLERSERKTFRQFTRYNIGGDVRYKSEHNFTDEIKNIVIMGIDEQYQDGAILFYALNADASRGALKTNKKEGANSFGAYLQDEIKFKDNLSLILGARYDVITYYSSLFYEQGTDTLPPYEAKSYSRLTPKAALSYNFTPNHSLYFNFGGGVEVPAGNETSPTDEYPNLQINPLLEPIISSTLELGTKQLLLPKCNENYTLKYDVALFYINVKNELVPYSDGKFFMSAGKTDRFGVESAVDFSIFDAIFLNTAFTYMNSKYSDYIVDLGLIDKTKVGQFTNYKDNKMAGVPEFYYNISLKGKLESLANLFVEANLRGVSKYFSDDANKFEIPSYNILNLTIGLDDYLSFSEYAKCRIYASINNLLDTKYAASGFVNPIIDKTTKAAYYLEPGLPRNFVVGLSFKFD